MNKSNATPLQPVGHMGPEKPIKNMWDYTSEEVLGALLEGNAEWRTGVGEDRAAFEEAFTAI